MTEAITNGDLLCCLTIAHDLTMADDLHAGLQRVAESLRPFVPYDTFSVLLIDDLGQELRFAHAVGYPEGVTEHWRFGLGQGLVGTVAASGEVLRVGDTSQDERYIDAGGMAISELAVPLKMKKRIIGVLDVGSSKADQFSRRHEDILTFLADHLAAAIDSARLYRSLKQQTQTLSMLHEVNRELTSILDRRRLLQNVARIVRTLIDYDLFTLLLWESESHRLEPAIAVRRDGREHLDSESMPLGVGICGSAAALRQPIRVPNTNIDPRFESCTTDDLPIRSELAVPLSFKDELLGVLDLGSTRYDAFSAQHEQILSTLASSLAIGLENTRLYERLRSKEHALASELSTGRELQRQLLPKSSPWIAGLQISVVADTAWQLGGDFYDFLQGDDDTVAFALGDVAGKGVSAALYGSLAVGTLREYFGGGDLCPEVVLADMNRRFCELGITNRFLALLFATHDGRQETLTLGNSGLPHPFLISNGQVSALEVEGTPLGMFPDRTYEQITIQLNPGDAVVLYSDGIDEARNRADEEFGQARIREVLAGLLDAPADRLSAGLLEAVDRHSDGEPQSDDRTIIVLKRT